MRRWLWAVVIVVLAPACGGGGSDGVIDVTIDDVEVTVDDVEVTISDVVVTLEVPDGAVPAGTEIEIEAGNVPADLAQISEVTVYAFDLEPSGLEFTEPATITFRLAAPGETGTPPASVIIEDSEGTATLLPAETTRRGDEVQVTALVDHFSFAYLLIGETQYVLTPELLEMGVGETKRSELQIAGPGARSFSHGLFLQRFNVHIGTSSAIFFPEVLPVASGFITVDEPSFGRVDVTCLKETDDVIEDAYEAVVADLEGDYLGRSYLDPITEFLAGPGANSRQTLRFLGDVKCNAASDGSSTGPPDEDPTVEEPEETKPGISVLAGILEVASLQLDFETHEDSRPISPYTANFDIEVDAEAGRIKKTQQPSDQKTEGPADRVTGVYFTAGGDKFFELYMGVVCPRPDGSYFIAGYTVGGAESIAETLQNLMDSIPGLDVSLNPPQSISMDPAVAPNCDDFASNPWELADWMRINLGPSGPIPGADWDLVFSGGFQP
ncbi:MAG: hypothetical protein V3S60_01815 [Acidimicrobiia bacterium]